MLLLLYSTQIFCKQSHLKFMIIHQDYSLSLAWTQTRVLAHDRKEYVALNHSAMDDLVNCFTYVLLGWTVPGVVKDS